MCSLEALDKHFPSHPHVEHICALCFLLECRIRSRFIVRWLTCGLARAVQQYAGLAVHDCLCTVRDCAGRGLLYPRRQHAAHCGPGAEQSGSFRSHSFRVRTLVGAFVTDAFVQALALQHTRIHARQSTGNAEQFVWCCTSHPAP